MIGAGGFRPGCGVMVSSGIGGLGTIESEHAKGEEKGFEPGFGLL